MAQINKLTIGLVGFGVVGEGIYTVLQQTPSLQASIKKVCIKNADKKRNAPLSLFTTEVNELLFDPEINVIVELIDDAEAACIITKKALQLGKHVVSANKKMIASHLQALLDVQERTGASLLYEAAVCGSIPVIRNLEEYYDNDLLKSVKGIINGSTNYILTKMQQENISYDLALHQAQQLGFAESNPALDVEGKDAVNKLCIILKHAYGISVNPQQILHKGITQLHDADNRYAFEKGYSLKLLAQAVHTGNGLIAALVLPAFVSQNSKLSHVHNEYNGVLVGSKLADEQFLYGKGAGRYPTSSAVLSDISALRYGYKYEYRKSAAENTYKLANDFILKIFVSYGKDAIVITDDFIEIETAYSSLERNYITGTIAAATLISAEWFHNQNVSVVQFEDVPVQAVKREDVLFGT